MSKVWRLDWEERVGYTAEIVADTEQDAMWYFQTGRELYTEPESTWAEMMDGPSIELVREA